MSEEGYYDLTLTKDGRIIYKKWVYVEEEGAGHYEYIDVTDEPFRFLSKSVKIEEGFTLDHLFKIVQDSVDILDVIFDNCWIGSFISHYKKIRGTWVPEKYEYHPDGIEFLRLYWNPELDEMENPPKTYIWGLDRPSFDGQGWELREDKVEDWGGYKKGTRINWGIDFSPIEQILHLPLILDEEFNVSNDTKHWKPNMTDSEKYALMTNRKYRLSDVIEGVFWELSFYGSPEDKEEKAQHIKGIKDELDEAIANGTIDEVTTPWDDFKKKIGLGDDKGEVV